MHGTSAGTRGQVLNNKVESAAPNHQGDNHSLEPRRFTNSEIACAAAKAKGTINLELQIKDEVSEFTPGFPSFEYPASSCPLSSCSYISGSLFKFPSES